ncbi:Methyltransferase domain-containing protein [Parafrankia irregularis]|uniref:Methyltransferase domain-containing protein n=1 Tax=Parafrankia irregularis TaxID=795642 RepID=A0A0S4QI64_9ACTN|nr:MULTISPECIES: daptide-type RiPP biosynthesis methyltransferase [Parafrankia]MBE3203930.1 class I SAM-dependent methyltransferase [Parafrankia sp. CH37]CUU55197.1 Methyltransferase domain-containing protein [Parafrankia irregularis]
MSAEAAVEATAVTATELATQATGPGPDRPGSDRPGTAGALIRMFGDALAVEDIYSERGSVLYDLLGGEDQHEISELLSALGGTRRSVLELAAGSGRLTLPMLRHGHDVVALEKSPMMLRLLGAKAAAAGHGDGPLTLVEGDMSRFDLGRRFDAVVLGATSVSLLDAAGRAAMFGAVRRHLAPTGMFLFSTLQMRRGPMLAQPVRENTHVLTVPAAGGPGGPGGSMVVLVEWIDGPGQQRLISAFRSEVDPAGTVDHRLFTSEVRLLDVADLERELAAAGLTVVGREQIAGGREPDRSTLLLRCVPSPDPDPDGARS